MLYACMKKVHAFDTEDNLIQSLPFSIKKSSETEDSLIQNCTLQVPQKRIKFHELLNDKWFSPGKS